MRQRNAVSGKLEAYETSEFITEKASEVLQITKFQLFPRPFVA